MISVIIQSNLCNVRSHSIKNVLLNYTIWLNLRALNMFSIKIQSDKCYN